MQPADAVTVAAELTKRGEIGRIGGAPYLHTLIAMVPTAANAGYYARIVRERAVLRRLVEAGTRIVQLGYAADGGDVDDIVNTAQAEVYAVTERKTSEDYLPLAEIINGTMEEIEAVFHQARGPCSTRREVWLGSSRPQRGPCCRRLHGCNHGAVISLHRIIENLWTGPLGGPQAAHRPPTGARTGDR